jgi:hypothetical protein
VGEHFWQSGSLSNVAAHGNVAPHFGHVRIVFMKIDSPAVRATGAAFNPIG